MGRLDDLLDQLQTKIPYFDRSNQAVSSSGVGWHIEHTLLTLSRIQHALSKSDPKDYKWKFNFIRILVFATNKIPRGRGKSPEVVQPKGNIDADSLSSHIIKIRAKTMAFDSMSKDQFFVHPYFGKLKLKQAIKFLEIHTDHHLKIINDILK